MVSPLSNCKSVRLGASLAWPDRYFPYPNTKGKKRYGHVRLAQSRSVNCLANPCAITSANIQNGFGGNEENVFFIEYISDSYQEKWLDVNALLLACRISARAATLSQ